MIVLVHAQEQRRIEVYQEKVIAYNQAIVTWEQQKSEFRTTRVQPDDESFIAAKRLNEASVERIIAHLELIRNAIQQTPSFPRPDQEQRRIDEKSRELQEAKTQASEDDTRTKIIRTASLLRRLWTESKDELIKPIVIKITKQKAEVFADKLAIIVARIKDQQGSLKVEGIDTFALDEAIKKIERNARKIRENIEIAENRLIDAERLNTDTNRIFEEASTRLQEINALGEETIEMIRDIKDKKEKYVGGALQ